MSLTLSQTYTAVTANINSSFAASGGTSPYTFSVLAGGAGGSINSTTGLYSAPSNLPTSPTKAYDTIQVVDSLSATATAQILVTSPLGLLSDVVQTRLGLDNFHCYWWDQKVFQPTDSGLYVIFSMVRCKPFSNNNYLNSSGSSVQYVNMWAQVDVDIISRSDAALYQKELVILAFNSTYAQQQQEANSFYIGKMPAGSEFINLSNVDGAAIPYRFKISIALQYFVQITNAVPYYNTFSTPTVATNP